MKEYLYTHVSKTDGLRLSVLRMEPGRSWEIKGIVQLVHGMNEYKERYRPFMTFLVKSGYITIIHDHRGHGKSIESPDDLGFFYEGGYEALIEDTHEITEEIKDYTAKLTGQRLPVILLGHSMGSMVVRSYIRKYDSDINKLVVIGCPSKLAGMKPGLALIKLFKKIKGERKRDMFISTLVMGGYEKRFRKEGMPRSWVNSNLSEVAKFNADPFCMFVFTLNGFENLVKLSMLTYTDGGYAMNNPNLPIKFFSGKDDPCAVSEKAFNKAIDHIKKQGYTNVSGRLYEGMRHEILNEIQKGLVYDEILEFIEM